MFVMVVTKMYSSLFFLLFVAAISNSQRPEFILAEFLLH